MKEVICLKVERILNESKVIQSSERLRICSVNLRNRESPPGA
jgi:hypothetical protein